MARSFANKAPTSMLAIAGWHVHGSFATSQDYQRLLRTAQIERARILRFQLDEETGIPGYVETRDTFYLELQEGHVPNERVIYRFK